MHDQPEKAFHGKHSSVERYGCCHSGEVPMDLMLRHQASLIKPVSFYIQLFEGQATQVDSSCMTQLLQGVS
jgi:hypothetical protein